MEIAGLGERLDDIPLLAQHFASTMGVTLPETVLESLSRRAWPGNVRQLRNAVQAYAALGIIPGEADTQRATDLDGALASALDLTLDYAQLKENLVDRFTRIYLKRLLASAKGNQTAAAKLGGLDRTYLGRLIAKHDLEGDS
jgi:DNA-binding NtrC family response regulator